MITNKQIKNFTLLLILTMMGVIRSEAGNVIVNSSVTANTTWTSNNIYLLTGIIYVKDNAVLTIEPGTIIEGDSSTLGSLVITRGSKLMAVGTATQPIIFTSAKPAGQRKRGDWGGVILLGYGPVNWPGDTGHVEGIVPVPETLYGGGLNPNCANGDCPDSHDNSGNLQYVRIEFAGVALSPNNEINGLTFGGVGDGTTINYIQVSYSNDDSYEWFGGTVNCNHLIAFRGIDDDFDTDNGFSGRVQFGVGLRDPAVADVSGSKGYESDNDPTGDNALPQTRGIFCNITSVAGGDTTSNPLFVSAAHIRRNSHLYIYNSISEGWPEGWLIDGTSSQNNVLADTMVDNNIEANTQPSLNVVTASPSDVTSVINLLQTGVHNHYYTGNAGVMLTDPYNLAAPDFQPMTGSPALTLGTNYSHPVLIGDPFFQHVSYLGAFDGTNDWTGTWANWDPENANYVSGINDIHVNSYSTVVFPNPVAGVLQATLSCKQYSDVKIQVTDISGRILAEKSQLLMTGANSLAIDVSQLAPGSYFLRIVNPQTNEEGISKFMKQ